ncbi:disease resistance protein At4g27190-like [Citrus sinensis]|uniref:disease resistance protein At4g27190-like n=1 Tax=Citrus sinensis TaxID=2711 RepID=UPI0022781BB1|nr:disease resistance protein At4g27190-like [Citrus sinensis]
MAAETVTSVTQPITEKIVDVLFNATVRRFGYLCKYKHYIEALRTEAKKLTDRRNDLQAAIDAATRNREVIKDEVKSWIAEVNDIIPKAETFLEDEVKVNKKCLGGLCVDLKSRCKLSREAEEKTMAMSALMAVGNFAKDVSRPAPPPAIISSSEGVYAFRSRESTMKDIMEAMKDENVSIIGICGMGGVGKTTLVKEIQKQAKEMNMFDDVAMAVVSQTPSITKIQYEIAGWLGLKNLPDNDESARASLLWERIKEKQRVLVILDDLWGRIKLSEVGIPYGKDHSGCNILLTSRSRAVCNQMNAHKIVEVGTLTKEESWSLFREVAGPEVDNLEINPTAREVADGCGGLPIAILTIGTALKDRDKHVWKDAAEQLKSSAPTNIEGMEEFVVSRVELSYNYLKSEEAKSIFRLCSCFPEDHDIPIEVLARYGWGLRCFPNVDSVEKARGRARSAVSTLIFSYLLIDGEEEGRVKMHDVVRYVAQQIASKNKFMIKAGVELKDWPSINTFEDLTGISLMFNDIHEVPDELECPKLQALFLQENSPLAIPDRFFQGMKDLKVLDLGGIRGFSLPSSLSFLINLRTLSLHDCRRFGDLPLIGELSLLEILDLSESDVSEIPVSFGRLGHLRLLDLTDCDHLELIPRGVLSSLRKLEELYMSDSFCHWQFESEEDARSNAKFIELAALSRLTSLHIDIPKGKIMPSDMSFQNLTSFSITIGEENPLSYFIEVFSRKFKKRCSRAMGLSQGMRISALPSWIKNLLLRSEILALGDVNDLENIVSDLANDGFNELMFLGIFGCNEMKCLLNSLERTRRVTLLKLEWLMIADNRNFVEICHGELPAGCLSNVKRLDVQYCGSVLKILPSHLVQSFQNLQRLRVESCELLVSVFEIERVNIAKEEIELFSSLEKLTLIDLPRMTDIWKGDTQFVSLRNLKKVEVHGCNELRQVFPASLGKKAPAEVMLPYRKRRDHIHIHATTSTSSPTPSLGNLVSITIQSCGKLRNLFTTSMVKSLVRLESLEVSSCPTLQEIIMDDEGEVGLQGASTEKITFPSLFSIQLYDLDSLACFCSSGLHATVEFLALEALQIIDCPGMKTFGYGDQLTPKLLKGVELEIGEYRWTGNLNHTVQQYAYNEKKIREKVPMTSGISSETTSSNTEN